MFQGLKNEKKSSSIKSRIDNLGSRKRQCSLLKKNTVIKRLPYVCNENKNNWLYMLILGPYFQA